MAALSSGAVRYRFYSRFGLSNEEVAKVILFCGVTVGVGLIALAGISLVFLPDLAGRVAGLGVEGSRIAGIACLLLIAAYLAAAAFVRGTVTLRKWTFDMPSLPLAIGQVAVGTANFVFVAACLHQLIGGEAGFGAVTSAYVVGNLAALVSHVPGGLGVLEATISYVMGGAASIGALIAFRVIYFFLPLPSACCACSVRRSPIAATATPAMKWAVPPPDRGGKAVSYGWERRGDQPRAKSRNRRGSGHQGSRGSTKSVPSTRSVGPSLRASSKARRPRGPTFSWS